MNKLKYYLRAIWLCMNICDICWWHYNEKYANEVNPYVMTIPTAWEVARGIWLGN